MAHDAVNGGFIQTNFGGNCGFTPQDGDAQYLVD